MKPFKTLEEAQAVRFAGVLQLPTILVDGAVTDPFDAGVMQRAIESRPEVAPVAIRVQGSITGGAYDVVVDLWGVEAGLPEFLLFTCVVETEVTLDPAGPNGQVHYQNVLREILPPPSDGSLGGTLVNGLLNGERRRFELSYALPADDRYDPNFLAVIAFAQIPETGQVLQTGSNLQR